MTAALLGPAIVVAGAASGWLAGRQLGRAVARRQIIKARCAIRHRVAEPAPDDLTVAADGDRRGE